jgi:hypothetical protein
MGAALSYASRYALFSALPAKMILIRRIWWRPLQRSPFRRSRSPPVRVTAATVRRRNASRAWRQPTGPVLSLPRVSFRRSCQQVSETNCCGRSTLSIRPTVPPYGRSGGWRQRTNCPQPTPSVSRRLAKLTAVASSPESGGTVTVLSDQGQAHKAETPQIDKSILAFPEPRRIRDRDHIRHVIKQACLICGRRPSDPHHLRFAECRALGSQGQRCSAIEGLDRCMAGFLSGVVRRSKLRALVLKLFLYRKEKFFL